MAQIVNGKQIANSVIETVKAAARALENQAGVVPGLAVIIVGCDPASHAYVRSKSRMAKECGYISVQHSLPVETTQNELAALVSDLNNDPSIHGILVQLPLPKHLDAEPVIQMIFPHKDVDGLHVVNVGKLATGDCTSGLVSCTPAGAMIFVRKAFGGDLSGLRAVVVGRSNLFGKPMAQLLLSANATVTIAHSRTRDLPDLCQQADILIAAVGQPEMVKSDWIKPGAMVIDVGINRVPGEGGGTRLVGDVAFDEAASRAALITPVPGGVGPMTIAMLMANTVIAAYRSAGLQSPCFQ